MFQSVHELLYRVNQYILNPIITLLFAVALVVFIWGIVQFISQTNNEEARAKGKQHLVWGIVGLLIMVSVFGIMQLIVDTFDLRTPENQNPVQMVR